VNPKFYKFPINIEEVDDQTESIANQLGILLPKGFHDWKDDDLTFEDDEILHEDVVEYLPRTGTD
jgi:hypothetical protein